MTRYQIEHTDCAYPATYHTDAPSAEVAARKVFRAVAAAQDAHPSPDALRWQGKTYDGRACFSAPSGTYFVMSLGVARR